MLPLVIRKVLLLLLIVPLLNALGFFYAVELGPEQVRAHYGFLLESPPPPFAQSYPAYLSGLAAGQLGQIKGAPLLSLIGEPLRLSLALLGAALALTVLAGPLLGLLAVSPQRGRIRPPALVGLTVGASLPGFFLGSLLITLLLYAARAGLSPGRGTLLPIQGSGLDAHLVLPALTLALRPMLYVAATGAGLLEHELQQDYIRVARSKGLGWRALLWRHALPNMRGTLVATCGQALRMLVSTLILVEALFDWRGIGRLLMQTVALTRNGVPGPYFLNPELLALLLMLLGGVLLLADLAAGIVAHLADPRLRGA